MSPTDMQAACSLIINKFFCHFEKLLRLFHVRIVTGAIDQYEVCIWKGGLPFHITLGRIHILFADNNHNGNIDVLKVAASVIRSDGFHRERIYFPEVSKRGFRRTAKVGYHAPVSVRLMRIIKVFPLEKLKIIAANRGLSRSWTCRFPADRKRLGCTSR